MRFLNTLFILVLFLLLIVTGGFFASREFLLWWGVRSFSNSIQELAVAANSANYASRCGTGINGGAEITETHIRFISNTEYVVEAICDRNTEKPILITKNQFSPYLSKEPGASGIIWGISRSSIKVTVFKEQLKQLSDILKIDLTALMKSRVVGIEDELTVVLPETEEELGSGPVTSCEGYGFQCCRPESHIGVGERITGLSECKDSCYSSCTNRPIVLAFTTLPFYDAKTRQLSVENNVPVDFNYVVDMPGATSVTAFLDFGDGSPQNRADGTTGKATHIYVCPTGSCTYVAKLKLVDNWQIESYDSSVSTVQVVVRGAQ